MGTETPRTTASEEGKEERTDNIAQETAIHQYWSGELRNRKDTKNSKNYQSHMEKEKKKKKESVAMFSLLQTGRMCMKLSKNGQKRDCKGPGILREGES